VQPTKHRQGDFNDEPEQAKPSQAIKPFFFAAYPNLLSSLKIRKAFFLFLTLMIAALSCLDTYTDDCLPANGTI
jgi:hypothetical protein